MYDRPIVVIDSDERSRAAPHGMVYDPRTVKKNVLKMKNV